jgi:hypothetical protein
VAICLPVIIFTYYLRGKLYIIGRKQRGGIKDEVIYAKTAWSLGNADPAILARGGGI